MTPLDCLRAVGRAQARDIARALGWRQEEVYPDLVAAEARGEARVEVTDVPRAPWSLREWVAL